jgi:predicted RNA-binding protein with PUA domain
MIFIKTAKKIISRKKTNYKKIQGNIIVISGNGKVWGLAKAARH